MGVEEQAARVALSSCNWDVNRATEQLFNWGALETITIYYSKMKKAWAMIVCLLASTAIMLWHHDDLINYVHSGLCCLFPEHGKKFFAFFWAWNYEFNFKNHIFFFFLETRILLHKTGILLYKEWILLIKYEFYFTKYEF